MGNFLFQTFILLPLSLLESIASILLVLMILLVLQAIGVPLGLDSMLSASDGGQSIEIFNILMAGAVGIVILGAVTLFLVFIDFKIRGINDAGMGWKLLAIIVTPIRFILQLIAGLFAFLGIFIDAIESDREFADSYSPFKNISSILFNFYIEKYNFSLSKYSDYKVEKALDKSYAKSYTKSRFGEENIKSRNILFQILILLPLNALQLFLTIKFYNGVYTNGKESETLLPLLWLFLLFILAIIVTYIKGHDASGEYWEKNHEFRNRKTDEVVKKTIEEGYEPVYDEDKYKLEKGGWTIFVRPATIFCFLFSSVFVFTQVISILIAIISNPYVGRVYSWYGEVDYNRCNHPFLQKILHFFFGFVILDEYSY